MISFEIQDMTCSHCREAVTRAVLGVDGAAGVEVDLSRHLVRIDGATPDAARFSEAIEAAGYTPKRVELQGEAGARSGAGGCSCASTGAGCGMRLAAFMGAPARPEPGAARADAGRLPRQGSCCSAGSSCGS